MRRAGAGTVLLALVACGRIGFDAADRVGADAGTDALGPPPAGHALPMAVVQPAGDPAIGNEADGTHMLFVDNTPGESGDLVVFREGENDPNLRVDVSADAGAQWKEYVIAPSVTVGINALGACQDGVGHAFHVSWVDTSDADQYARLVPTYSAGHIIGFELATSYAFFDDYEDSPSPRDLAEVVDGDGVHRLLFLGAATSGSNGRLKLAVTTPAVGVAPASQNDWAKATDHTALGQDDPLLPNDYMTEDGDTTYMVSVAADPAASDAPPTLLLAGFPADRKLLAWTVARGSGADFTVSTMQSLATSFGGGTGLRTDASLSAVSAPTTGTVWFAYGEDGSASAPGIHVGAVGPSGIILDDAVAQPSTSAAVRHAVLGIDTSGRPGLLYADGAGIIDATLLWNGAWLPDVQVTSLATPVAAWGVSDAWQVDGHDGFAMYADSGSGAGTTFAAVSWY